MAIRDSATQITLSIAWKACICSLFFVTFRFLLCYNKKDTFLWKTENFFFLQGREKILYGEGIGMAKIIGIINQKGGVGKTTTAVNLSAFLAKHSRRVLIVDTDSQGNATSGLSMERRHFDPDIYDVMMGNAPVEEAIVDTDMKRLFLLPASMNLSVDYAQNLVVIKTMPGLANGAAAALDGMEVPYLVGSLAGDDTVLLVLRDNAAAAEFADEIKEMLR